MNRNIFYKQAELMIRILPLVAEQSQFALKGGTALNFFVLDMPRLSVDIDLCFLPILDRGRALFEISEGLDQISNRIKDAYGYRVYKTKLHQTSHVVKLFVQDQNVQVKLEPNLVTRGSVFPTENRVLSSKVQEVFGQYVEMPVLAEAELYGSKLCAALDRQHPRDLFDIYQLCQKSGITPDIQTAFLIYLLSHQRPISELLAPNLKDISAEYGTNFKGMPIEDVELAVLLDVRNRLISDVLRLMPDTHKQFILSVATGEPKFSLLSHPNLESFPAIKWKLLNVSQMSVSKKRVEVQKLESLLA